MITIVYNPEEGEMDIFKKEECIFSGTLGDFDFSPAGLYKLLKSCDVEVDYYEVKEKLR